MSSCIERLRNKPAALFFFDPPKRLAKSSSEQKAVTEAEGKARLVSSRIGFRSIYTRLLEEGFAKTYDEVLLSNASKAITFISLMNARIS